MTKINPKQAKFATSFVTRWAASRLFADERCAKCRCPCDGDGNYYPMVPLLQPGQFGKGFRWDDISAVWLCDGCESLVGLA